MLNSIIVRPVYRWTVPSSSFKLLLGLLLVLGTAVLPAADLVAVTRSGRTFTVSQVDPDVRRVSISLHGTGATLDDPIIDIRGFDGLSGLVDLRIYHAPQIDSYDFLTDASRLEVLVISFARVRNIGFLSSMPSLRVLVLEFCDDWESGEGLPFLADPMDLTANPRIEYIGFRICALKSMPRFAFVPESLEYIDLSYNSIDLIGDDLSFLEALNSVNVILVNGNPIDPIVVQSIANMAFYSADDILDRYLSWSQ